MGIDAKTDRPFPSEDGEDLELGALTARQAMFVREYLIDLNATAAAVRAGYSGKAANHTLQLPHVAAAVERGKAQRASRVGITAEAILYEMSLLANSCIDHYKIDDFGNVCLTEGAPDGAMAAVKSIKKRIRHGKDGEISYEVDLQLWDKPSSLKLMGKHAGIKAFSDRVEVTGPDGGPIPITEIRTTIIDPKGHE